jgi:thiosulfate dehydrogenase [quinone] large subunit
MTTAPDQSIAMVHIPPRTDEANEPLRAAIVLLPLRLFLAAGWLRASAEKLIDPAWWNGTTLRSFLVAQQHDALPFFRPVMRTVLMPVATQVAVVVAIGQLLIGVAIAIGRPLRLALWCGVVLNVVFVMCGKVNPSAFYLVMEAALLYAISTGHVGKGERTPSVRSFALIGAWLAGAAAMAPFVRTIEPKEVIEDPAMMLVFLCMTMAGTTFARWLHHHGERVTAVTELSLQPVHSWLTCGAHRRPDSVPLVGASAYQPVDHLQLAWQEMTDLDARPPVGEPTR